MSPSDTPRPDSGSLPDNRETDRSFATALDDKPIWSALYDDIRDAWFAPRLPELELTSAPVAVPDRMAMPTNRWAVGTSTIVNGGALALVILLGLGKVMHSGPNSDPRHTSKLSDIGLFVPRDALTGGGGGGGGSHDLIDPIIGRTPRPAANPLVPVQIPVLSNPKLPIDSAIAVPLDIRLPDNPSLPTIGVHESANVRLLSGGPGDAAGIGTGIHGGDGPGNGPGYGPGWDGSMGGGPQVPGRGGVSYPIPLFSPEAEFSDEARRAKYQGICAISIIVDAHGYPQNPRVVRSLGMGLDEKALEAVARYRFKPALKNGKPVPALITVEVNFRLY